MGFDELQPLSKRGKNNFGGLGATVIDSLDTLWIMGLTDQYSRAREWVAKNLHFNKDYQASVFETTIRIVGGLVAAFDLSVRFASFTRQHPSGCRDLLLGP